MKIRYVHLTSYKEYSTCNGPHKFCIKIIFYRELSLLKVTNILSANTFWRFFGSHFVHGLWKLLQNILFFLDHILNSILYTIHITPLSTGLKETTTLKSYELDSSKDSN